MRLLRLRRQSLPHRRRPDCRRAAAAHVARLDPERGARELARSGDDGRVLAVAAPPPVRGHYGGRVGASGTGRERPRVHHAARRAGHVDAQAHPRAGALGGPVHRDRRVRRVHRPTNASGQASYAHRLRRGAADPLPAPLQRRGNLRGPYDLKVDGAQVRAPVRCRHRIPARPRVGPRRERLVELIRDGKVAAARCRSVLLGPGRVWQRHGHDDLPALVRLGKDLAGYPDRDRHVGLHHIDRLLDGQAAVPRLVVRLRPRGVGRARRRRRDDGDDQQGRRQASLRPRRAGRSAPSPPGPAHRARAAAVAKNVGGRASSRALLRAGCYNHTHIFNQPGRTPRPPRRALPHRPGRRRGGADPRRDRAVRDPATLPREPVRA